MKCYVSQQNKINKNYKRSMISKDLVQTFSQRILGYKWYKYNIKPVFNVLDREHIFDTYSSLLFYFRCHGGMNLRIIDWTRHFGVLIYRIQEYHKPTTADIGNINIGDLCIAVHKHMACKSFVPTFKGPAVKTKCYHKRQLFSLNSVACRITSLPKTFEFTSSSL